MAAADRRHDAQRAAGMAAQARSQAELHGAEEPARGATHVSQAGQAPPRSPLISRSSGGAPQVLRQAAHPHQCGRRAAAGCLLRRLPAQAGAAFGGKSRRLSVQIASEIFLADLTGGRAMRQPFRRGVFFLLVAALTSHAAKAAESPASTPGIQVTCADDLVLDACAPPAAGTTAAAGEWNLQCALDKRLKNVVLFDHRKAAITYPVPTQVEVADGDPFVVVIVNTDPTQFKYQITGAASQTNNMSAVSGTPVLPRTCTNVAITQIHDRHNAVYTVAINLVSGPAASPTAPGGNPNPPGGAPPTGAHGEHALAAPSHVSGLEELVAPLDIVSPGPPAKPAPPQPEGSPTALGTQTTGSNRAANQDLNGPLYAYTFTVAVKTGGFRLTFTSGFEFSGLTSKTYSIVGNQVVEDTRARDSFRPDLSALANLQFPKCRWSPYLCDHVIDKFGLAFGIGLGADSDARYYFGPSFALGSQFILTAGIAGGKVSTLPAGQSLGAAPINGANTLNSLPTRFTTSWYVGITFGFTNTEKQFTAAVTQQQTSDGKAPATN